MAHNRPRLRPAHRLGARLQHEARESIGAQLGKSAALVGIGLALGACERIEPTKGSKAHLRWEKGAQSAHSIWFGAERHEPVGLGAYLPGTDRLWRQSERLVGDDPCVRLRELPSLKALEHSQLRTTEGL